jgi:hypothetical protein
VRVHVALELKKYEQLKRNIEEWQGKSNRRKSKQFK